MFIKTTHPYGKGHRRSWGQWTQVPAGSYPWRKGRRARSCGKGSSGHDVVFFTLDTGQQWGMYIFLYVKYLIVKNNNKTLEESLGI